VIYPILLAGLVILAGSILATALISCRARVRELNQKAMALEEHYAARDAIHASEARSKFLAEVSDEVRTPVNSILGFAQLLLEEDFGPLNERQSRYVGHIRSSGQQLLTMINDILDFSGVQTGRIELALEDVPIRSTVDEVLARAAPAAEAKGLKLTFEEGPDAQVRTDRQRLAQVLWNLVSNAIKFTPAGSVTVSLTSTRTQARLSVVDTGIGIAPEDRFRIFDEFTRLRGTGGGSVNGTGLGLALTHKLVELMDGSIAVESTPNEGSTFTVILPLAESAHEATEAPAFRPAV
jgi:signal transduction histidine kinase